jgi:hypothetical protein
VVTVVRIGHPLRGTRLRVDPAGGLSRKDRRLQVLLPDGSTSLLPVDWTDLGAPATVGGATPTRLNLEGLRRLLRLVDVLNSKDGDARRVP